MSPDLPRKLGLLDSLSIVVGTVIGGGIFLVPNLVARNLYSAPAILAVWAFAGVVSFFGALACAELGAALPATGGQYVFLREAFGPLAAFLCGWSMFTVVRTAQVAWMAVTFSLYLSYSVPMSTLAAKAVGLALIAVFAWINYRGVTAGALVQKTFTLAKVGGLVVLIGGALWMGGPAAEAAGHTSALPHSGLSSFGVALIACLLSYDGWVQVSFVAGEIRNPNRNILPALAVGTGAVIVIYLLANLAYLRVLPVAEIAQSDHVGADAAARVFGPSGGTLISIMILISIVGTLNGCFLTTPRVYFAQARDGHFFRRFGQVHPRHQTPGFAIVAQGLWAAVLLLTGSYETLVDYAMFTTWLFYGLMVGAVMVLRRRRPDLSRPYRMWGYPATPLLFLAITGWFLVNMLLNRPWPSLAGLLLIAAGIPVYSLWANHDRAAAGTREGGQVETARRPVD